MSLKNRILLIVLCSVFHKGYAALEFSKYGSDFLNSGVGARPLALGGAYTGLSDDVTSLYWNPAGLSHLKGMQFHFMHSERFAGVVNWDCLLFGLPVRDGYHAGIGFYRLGVDDIPLTRLTNPDLPLGDVYVDNTGKTVQNVPYVYRSVSDVEMAVVLGFSKRQSEKLVLGGNVTLIRKDMDVSNAWGIGFDFGALYRPMTALQLGASLKNATTTLLAWSTGRNELIYPRLLLGGSYKYTIQKISLLPVADVEINREASGVSSEIRIDRFGIGFHGGIEVAYLNRIAFRVGSDMGKFTGGVGLKLNKFSLDYGFSSHVDLGNSHRLSVGVFLASVKKD